MSRALGAQLREIAQDQPFVGMPASEQVDPVPIWLLDVDGVINCLDHTSSDWPTYTQIVARGYTIHYAPALVAQIAELHHSGKVEVWWLTTWRNHANIHLAEAFGLPQLQVANTNPEYSVRDRWWKLPVAQRVVRQTGRRIIWTDDDLQIDPEALQWVAYRKGQVLGISPNPDHGLTPAHLQRIHDWLTEA